MKEADVLAQSDYKREEKLENIRQWDKIYKGILERGECVSVKELKINGNDLKDLGVKPGPVMGEILDELLQEVLDDPSKNTPKYLRNRVTKLISER